MPPGALVATALHEGRLTPGGSASQALTTRCVRSSVADRLQRLPAGDPVDLEHDGLAVRRDEQVHAGDVGLQCAGRREREAALGLGQVDGPRTRAARDVGSPRVGHALHRAGDLAGDDEHAQVSPAGGRDRALDVVDGPLQLQGAEHSMGHIAVLDAHDPVAHGAEQRLDDDVAAQPLERPHRAVVALAHDRGRGGHAGQREHRAGPRLVDRPLDRARAVDAPDAVLGEDVQRIHAEDHLLQRAAGEPADDQQVQRVQRHAVGSEHVDVSALVDLGLQPRGGDREHLVAASRRAR